MSERPVAQNRMNHIFTQSLLEIIGVEKSVEMTKWQVSELIAQEQIDEPPPADLIDQTGAALSLAYGDLAAQGLLIRAGRAALVFFRRYYPEVAALGAIENRLKPVDVRFDGSLNAFADLWAREIVLASRVERESRAHFRWVMSQGEGKSGGEFYVPFFLFGLLEELCSWLDARKNYQLAVAAGGAEDQTQIEIDILPME